MANDIDLDLLDETTPSPTGGPPDAEGNAPGDEIRAQDLTDGIKRPTNAALSVIETVVNTINDEIAANTAAIVNEAAINALIATATSGLLTGASIDEQDLVLTRRGLDDLRLTLPTGGGNGGTTDPFAVNNLAFDVDTRVLTVSRRNGVNLTATIPDQSTAVAANATAISTNATAIAANAGAIGTNTSDIATNASAITANQGAASTNAGAIAANATAIAALPSTGDVGDLIAAAITGSVVSVTKSGNTITVRKRDGTENTFDVSGGALTPDQAAFFTHVARTAGRVDLDAQTFINASNVVINDRSVTGVPVTFTHHDTNTDSDTIGTIKTVSFAPPASSLQFPSLLGGRLTLTLRFQTNSVSGFPPDPQLIAFGYGAHSFAFGLANAGVDVIAGGTISLTLDIPEADYSDAINVTPSVTYRFTSRGASYVGRVVVESIRHELRGPLHDAIVQVAQDQASTAVQLIQPELDRIRGDVSAERTSLSELSGRASPLRTKTDVDPVFDNVYFGAAPPAFGGVPPSSTIGLTAATRGTPGYLLADGVTGVWVVAPGGPGYFLRDTTDNSRSDLSRDGINSNANAEVVTSFFDGVSFFVYHVIGLTAGRTYELDITVTSTVVAWQDDIDVIKAEIQNLMAEIGTRQILNAGIVGWLNSITFAESVDVAKTATDLNNNAGLPGQQAFEVEQDPVTALVASNRNTGPLNARLAGVQNPTDAQRGAVGRKLIYLPRIRSDNRLTEVVGVNDSISSPGVPLLRATAANRLEYSKLIPATTAGTQQVRVHPLPPNLTMREWWTLDTSQMINGAPTAVTTEVVFTRLLPTAPFTVTVRARSVANGNPGAVQTFTVEGSPTGREVTGSTVITVGQEAVTVSFDYNPSTRLFRVAGEPNSNGWFILDVQFQVYYDSTETVPAVPAHSEWQDIGPYRDVTPVLIEPSVPQRAPLDTAVFNIATPDGVFSTNHPVGGAAGNDTEGFYRIAVDTSNPPTPAIDIFDWSSAEIPALTAAIASSLLAAVDLPFRGLFTERRVANSVAELATQLQAMTADGGSILLAPAGLQVFRNNATFVVALNAASPQIALPQPIPISSEVSERSVNPAFTYDTGDQSWRANRQVVADFYFHGTAAINGTKRITDPDTDLRVLIEAEVRAAAAVGFTAIPEGKFVFHLPSNIFQTDTTNDFSFQGSIPVNVAVGDKIRFQISFHLDGDDFNNTSFSISANGMLTKITTWS